MIFDIFTLYFSRWLGWFTSNLIFPLNQTGYIAINHLLRAIAENLIIAFKFNYAKKINDTRPEHFESIEA